MLGKAMDVLEAIWDESRSIVDQLADPGPDVGDAASRASRVGQSEDVRQALQGQSAASGESYVVVSGDTLSGIAGRLLGDPARWPEIAALNGIDDPRTLAVGRTLVLPTKDGGATSGAQEGAAGAREEAPSSAGGDTASEGGGDTTSEGGGGLLQWLLPDMDPNLGTTQAEPAAQGGEQQGPQEAPGPQEGQAPVEPAWVSVARGEMGVKEIVGPQHNPRVLEYHTSTASFSDDETPWCASFVNWVLAQSGQSGTGSAMALSFSRYGTQLDAPAYGSIAVISWGGGKGHVGFVVGKQGNKILLLGGNQSNEVNIKPFSQGSIVAYVVPSGYTVPASAYALSEGGDGPSAGSDGGLESTR